MVAQNAVAPHSIRVSIAWLLELHPQASRHLSRYAARSDGSWIPCTRQEIPRYRKQGDRIHLISWGLNCTKTGVLSSLPYTLSLRKKQSLSSLWRIATQWSSIWILQTALPVWTTCSVISSPSWRYTTTRLVRWGNLLLMAMNSLVLDFLSSVPCIWVSWQRIPRPFVGWSTLRCLHHPWSNWCPPQDVLDRISYFDASCTPYMGTSLPQTHSVGPQTVDATS